MQNLHTVEKVFADRLFLVPDYQRGYAWDCQQWREFLEDLELMEENGFVGVRVVETDGLVANHSISQ